MFGGVNRLFELAERFGELGVECVIARPDAHRTAAASGFRASVPTIRASTVSFSEALGRSWDAVLCGDCTGGVMLTMPLFGRCA